MSPAVDWLVARLDRQQPLEKSRYIICLGGDPYRVLESATLFNEGWGDILVVSNHDEAADRMQRWAIEWGVPAESIIVDRGASRTRDHPSSVLSATGLDPARDSCLIVTDFTHLARSKACFLKAGFRCIIMREPRWTRALRTSGTPSIKHRLLVVPELVYEGAAWIEYWFRGAV